MVAVADELEGDFKAMEGVISTFQTGARETALMIISSNSTAIAALSHVPKSLQGKLDAGKWISSTVVPLGGKGGGKSNTARGTCSQKSRIDEVETLAREYARGQF